MRFEIEESAAKFVINYFTTTPNLPISSNQAQQIARAIKPLLDETPVPADEKPKECTAKKP